MLCKPSITQVPDGIYKKPAKREPTFYRSKSNKSANRMPFVRKVSHQKAIKVGSNPNGLLS